MSGLTIKIDRKFVGLMQNPDFSRGARKILGKSKRLVEREYKREVPVDTGVARGAVVAKDIAGGLGFFVTTIATNRGFPYPIAVHEGTGKYRGRPDTGMSKRKGGGMPNKFADRAYRKVQPQLIVLFNSEVSKLIRGDGY